MKLISNLFKWTCISFGSLLVLLLLAGATTRLLSPAPQAPGELIDVGGYHLHLHRTGEQNELPTLVIEAGAGAPGEYYHWLSEGLKEHLRVVRYDRAGIGYSEFPDSPRDPETAVQELHQLLEAAGEKPPYLMAGHSYGGHYIRMFAQRYPEEVAGLVFLDASHPETGKRMGLPSTSWFMDPMYKLGVVVGDIGLLHLYDHTLGPILWAPGLPEEVVNQVKAYTYDGDFIRGYLKGDGNDTYSRQLRAGAAAADDFGDLPIRVFSGTHQNDKALLRLGVDPEHFRSERIQMQKELAALSTDSELYFLDAGHVTIFTLPEHAEVICEEVLEMVAGHTSNEPSSHLAKR
ncbi:MAG: alpha/beta hydrolase [Bacteroidota bacterium]